MTLWYMSFATPEKFLGAIIVEAGDIMSALAKTHVMGINPGGEVWYCEIDEDFGMRDRIITKDELDRLGEFKRYTELTDAQQEYIELRGNYVKGRKP